MTNSDYQTFRKSSEDFQDLLLKRAKYWFYNESTLYNKQFSYNVWIHEIEGLYETTVDVVLIWEGCWKYREPQYETQTFTVESILES